LVPGAGLIVAAGSSAPISIVTLETIAISAH